MDKLRKCKGKCNIYENGKWHSHEFELGYFHQWAQIMRNLKVAQGIIQLRLLNCRMEGLSCQ